MCKVGSELCHWISALNRKAQQLAARMGTQEKHGLSPIATALDVENSCELQHDEGLSPKTYAALQPVPTVGTDPGCSFWFNVLVNNPEEVIPLKTHTVPVAGTRHNQETITTEVHNEGEMFSHGSQARNSFDFEVCTTSLMQDLCEKIVGNLSDSFEFAANSLMQDLGEKDSVNLFLKSPTNDNFTPTFTSSPCKLDSQRLPFPYQTSKAIEEFGLDGVRLVDMNYFIEKSIEASNHNLAFGCSLSNMNVVKEIYKGMSSTVIFHCNMCNIDLTVSTHDPEQLSMNMDVNTRAVAGIMSISGGFSHLEEFCSIGLPCMLVKTYSKLPKKVCDGWEKAAALKMEEAAKEEAAIV